MSDTDTVQDVAKDEAEGSQKSKQKPKATKQKIVEDRDEETEDQGEEEDEAQKIMKMITTVASKGFSLFLTFIKFVLGLLRGAIGCVRSALGAVFGLGIFLTFAYVVSSYVIEEVVEEDVPDFEARLKFLLRCEIWPILPVILAAAVGTMSKNDLHTRFSRERFEQALLFLFNLLLFSTHLQTECLTCVRACALVNAAFSMLFWACQVYTKKSGSLFCRAGTHFNFIALTYNVYVILGQDFGYLSSAPSMTSVPTQTEPTSGWFS